MAHTRITFDEGDDQWFDTGVDGPAAFWSPMGQLLVWTGADPNADPQADENARQIQIPCEEGGRVEYGGTDRVWVKPLSITFMVHES